MQNVEHQNVIRVKFKENGVKSLETSKFSRTANNYIITGLPSLDALNKKNGAINYKRVFSDGGKFAVRRRAFGLHLWYEITFDKDAAPAIEQLLTDFEKVEYVDLTEPIYKKSFQRIEGSSFGSEVIKQNKGLNAMFNDPRVGEQWHYDNTGQSGGTVDADIDLAEAWDITTGSSDVIVSIHDGGIDYDHEDIAGNMWVNSDELNGSTGVDDDGNGYIDDVYGYNFVNGNGNVVPDPDGHGTHVAGTVAAESNNSVGVAGVAGGSGSGDGARLMSCQVFTSGGGGFAESYVYAADNGSIISQNSWGYTSPGNVEQSVLDAIDYFIANAGFDASGNPVGPMQGGIVIFSAGNSDADGEYYPGFYDPILSVASTNHNDQKAWYSNYGTWVDISAPGGETNSVSEEGVLSTLPNDSYGFFQGTSMACPHVSGVAALIVSEYGGAGFTPLQLRNRLVGTTDDIEALNPSYNGELGSGRMNAFGALLTDDGIAPDAIADLAIDDVLFNGVTLIWTSPVDDDNFSAASYEIRYSTSTIDETNFNAATLAGSISAQTAGSSESYDVEGLIENTAYYFAIKSYDFFSNASEISNVASVTTEQAPEISVTPTSLTSNLLSGDSEIQNIVIENIGLGSLNYTLPSFTSVSTVNRKNKPNGDQLVKGQKDIRSGLPVLTGSGDDGDSFGYRWIDSNEVGGPSFNWVDISGTGTSLPLSDDDSESVSLPFDFPFYDEFKNTVYVSSNGFLTFSSTSSNSLSNSTLPFASSPNDLIALLWDDLNPSSGGEVYYLSEPDRFIVQYDNVPLYGAGGSYTFQCILYPNGDITIQYLSLSSALYSYTSGIENADGTGGLEIAYNAVHAENNLAVSITKQPSIISGIDPYSGSLAPGEQISLDVAISADGLNGGTYDDEIAIESNDPNNSLITVPLTLNVTGAPSIETTDALEFNEIFIGGRDSLELLVINNGSDVLDVSLISIDNAVFTTNTTPFSLGPDEVQDLVVYFDPVAVSNYTGAITINSNDATDPSVIVNVSGSGVEPPVIAVNPASLTEDLFTGETSTQSLTIANNGSADLVVDMSTSFVGVSTSHVNNSVQSSKPKAANTDLNSLVDYSKIVNSYDLSGKSILYFTDMSGSVTESVLKGSTADVTGHIDNFSNFIIDLTSLSWDLVIFESGSNSWSSTELIDYVNGGGKLITSYWSYDSDASLVAAMEAIQTQDITTPLEVNAWHTTHAIFTNPNSISLLTPNGDSFNDNGDKFNPEGSGLALAGYTSASTADEAAIVLGNDGNTLLNGFVFKDYLTVDNNTNGVDDINELLENQISFLLGGNLNWLNLALSSAVVPAGESVEVNVNFDATGLNGGAYEAEIALLSNDPVTPSLTVPITLNVTGAPNIEVTPSLSFNNTFVNGTDSISFVMANNGSDILDISSMSIDNVAFSTGLSSFSIQPNGDTTLVVYFEPVLAQNYTGILTITSNDPTDPTVDVNLSGNGVEPPVIDVSPVVMTENLFTGGTSMQTLTVNNSGGSDLTFELSLSQTVPSPSKYHRKSSYDKTISRQEPANNIDILSAEYSGEFISFGISDYGEIMPFQYTIGNEHLAVGSFISGYSVVYNNGSGDVVYFTNYESRSGINAVSYTELVNNSERVEVEVITETADNAIQIIRYFTFVKNTKSVVIDTELKNISGSAVTDVVFKTFADWDVDGDFDDDNWNIDESRNMIYAYDNSFVSIATFDVPDFIDMDGWDDFSRRLTDGNVVGSVNDFDGFELLHYELGDLTDGDEATLKTAFASGDNLEELQLEVDRAIPLKWLTVNAVNGSIAPSGSQDLEVHYDAAGLFGGTYDAEISIISNDPSTEEIVVPVTLEVTGAPDIDVNPVSIDFGDTFTNVTQVDTIIVNNYGTDELTLSVSNSNDDFEILLSEGSVAPGEEANIVINYSPSMVALDTDIIEVISNDPDEPLINISLSGNGVVPPVIGVDPISIESDLDTGETVDHIITIENTGASDLIYDLNGDDVTSSILANNKYGGNPEPFSKSEKGVSNVVVQESGLKESETISMIDDFQSVVDELNDRNAEITALLSNYYLFSGGDNGNSSISDGGGDMYDGGNRLGTEMGDNIPYTDGVIEASPSLNGADYFTAKYPGLFIFGAHVDDYNTFGISGNLGADGSGNVDGSVINLSKGGQDYLGFVKRVYNAGDPSVNHLIIVENNGSANHEFDTNTDNDFHQVNNLPNNSTLYYLLFAGSSGHYYDDAVMIEVMSSFLDIVKQANWLEVNGPFSGIIEAGSSEEISLTLDAAGLLGGTYTESLIINSNDPTSPVVDFPITLNVTGVPNIETDRKVIDFGDLPVNRVTKDSILISNVGVETLIISDVISSDEFVKVDKSSFELLQGETAYLVINCSPTDSRDLDVTLSIRSNDTANDPLVVSVLGRSVCDEFTNDIQVVKPIENQIRVLADESFSIDLKDVYSSNSSVQYSAYGNSTIGDVSLDGSVLTIDFLELGLMTVTTQAYNNSCGKAEEGFTLTIEEITALENDLGGKISVHPVPVEDELTIGGLTEGRVQVEVWNMQGQLVKAASSLEMEVVKIDMRKVKTGMYIIHIITDSKSETRRISVRH